MVTLVSAETARLIAARIVVPPRRGVPEAALPIDRPAAALHAQVVGAAAGDMQSLDRLESGKRLRQPLSDPTLVGTTPSVVQSSAWEELK